MNRIVSGIAPILLTLLLAGMLTLGFNIQSTKAESGTVRIDNSIITTHDLEAAPAHGDILDDYEETKLGFISGEILVKFKSSVSVGCVGGVATANVDSVNELNKRFRVVEMRKVLWNVYKLVFPNDVDVFSMVKEYEANLNVEYAEPNYIYHTCVVPNDADYALQWALKVIQSDAAWDIEKGDPNVVIAIVDTGVDWDHPDLAANIWNNVDEAIDGTDTDGNGYIDDVRGYDFVDTTTPVWPGEDGTERDNDPMDFHGHGTHCAGIAAAVTNNRMGIAGVSWYCKIMPVRAGYLGADGGGYLENDDCAAAIEYAADNGAKIISMSWGSSTESAVILDAVKYAYDKGVLLVAAAGNDATSLRHYPSTFDEVVAVAATDESDNPASWTNFGKSIEVAAPGVNIYSTVWNDSYTSMSGTSMSTPHVAGVTALIYSQFPYMTRDQVRARLRYASDDPGDDGFDIYYGYGRINARRAVEQTPDDHDLLIFEWEKPLHVKPGKTTKINSTVLNFGNNDERAITVQLMVNGSVVDSAFVSFLASGESATVSCSWTPTSEGKYNITAYVVPTSGEIAIDNNVVSSYAIVRTEEMFRVPEDYSRIQEAIDAANSGYRINVAAGTYYERVVVDKSVSIIGEDVSTTIVDAWVFDSWLHGTGTVFYVNADNVNITGFSVQNGEWGIVIFSDNNTLIGNRMKNNYWYGMLLYECSNNYLRDNSMADNKYNFGVGGYVEHVIHDIDISNTVNGKPIYYWINQHDRVIPADAGYVCLVNCTGITVTDLNLTNNRHGVDLVLSRNSIVRNVNATDNARDGILLYEGSSNITVTGCTSLNNRYGVRLVGAKNNSIFDNVVMNNTSNGIYLTNSNNNTVVSNWILDNGWNGISLAGSHNNTVIDNWATNSTMQGMGLWNSINNTVSSNVAENNGRHGIYLYNSSHTIIEENVLANSTFNGIYLYNSSSNTVVSNWALDNGYHGISLDKSYNNLIGSNKVVNNTWQGVGLWNSINNTVRSNWAERNEDNGFYLWNSTGNTITGNTAIRNKWYGVFTEKAGNNLIYQNDFIDNKKKQAYSLNSVNAWDNGYEYGGNYWSDYEGKDEFSGPNQDEPGSDGTGDTPYVIDQNNQDHYPRMTTLVYDVTLINITSSIHTYSGWTVNINVAIKNNGYVTEDLLVVAYYDNNTIGTTTIIGLAPDENITVTISWDTTNVQLYTEYMIWAEAIPVPGETSIADNIMIEKTVKIRIPGDINGDEEVNIKDIATVAKAYGSKPGDPNWNPTVDLDSNKEINIKDIARVAKEYGKKWKCS